MHLPVSVQVRLMGGKIDLTTRVGIGTTFHFVVHFGIPKQTNETTGALEKESQDPEMSSDLRGKQAILVDGIPLRRMVPPLPSSSHLFVTVTSKRRSCLSYIHHIYHSCPQNTSSLISALAPKCSNITVKCIHYAECV